MPNDQLNLLVWLAYQILGGVLKEVLGYTWFISMIAKPRTNHFDEIRTPYWGKLNKILSWGEKCPYVVCHLSFDSYFMPIDGH